MESNKISLALLRGSKEEKGLSLEQQSTGFRWFFNLYFNLLVKQSLDAGDIIVMDEPATNLHPNGQIELRKFLKDFAIKNDITIIIATHLPFLIDLDYLDELRVVKMNDNRVSIVNNFAAIDSDDPDTLKHIKNALMTSKHVLFDFDSKVVFVEGITDYNYLSMFKKIFQAQEDKNNKNKVGDTKDIVFLPINGVGDKNAPNCDKKQLEISKRLIDIRKNNPILLVDSDEAGRSMKEANKKDSALNIICLGEINKDFKTIEDLFDKDDLSKLNLVNENGEFIKHSSQSSLIKTHCANYEFSDKTLENFKKLFDRLRD
ncbi:AAA family ATPase [Helicobacter sp. 16-1353]|uniref:ATP-dependent nuclease n=1 Tax=Helicobacter sp. 16-1353 TaxID=2004996 RepID=UPI001C6574F0|nr:AAA family ATPase [Helicobacter sp. 16-1353]